MELCRHLDEMWATLTREPLPLEEVQRIVSRAPSDLRWTRYEMRKCGPWRKNKGDRKAAAEILWKDRLGVIFLSGKWSGTLEVVGKAEGYKKDYFFRCTPGPGGIQSKYVWANPMDAITFSVFPYKRRSRR